MGWTFTQAQLIALIICLIGITGIFLSVMANKKKIKSPEFYQQNQKHLKI
jgi:hypothetical protein